MAVETSPGHNPSRSAAATGSGTPPARVSNGPGVLLPGERVIAELGSGGDGYFRLTSARVIFSGGGVGGAVYASVLLKDISSVQIFRRPRARRSAAWGVVGLFSAIGVWQVTPDSVIGIAAAVAVALVSLVLMADYWIRPAGVHLEVHTAGGKVDGGVGGSASDALEFAREVEDERRRPVPARTGMPFRKYPTG